MQLEPKVSVIIPSLNVAAYIRECLESVINQTLKDIEIICIDAGSSDGTFEILKEYELKDSRIKVMVSDKRSYGYQVNLGMDNATGKYFAIVESDDIINLQMYEKLFALAEEHQLDIIKADFCRFVIDDGAMKKEYAKIAQPGMYGRVLTSKETGDIITKAALYTWSGIYRKEYLYENGIRHNETPGASYQDNGFWFQTMATAERVYFLEENFYMLRRDNPNSSIMSKGKVYCIRDEYEFVMEYLKQRPELYEKVIIYYWWARFGAYRYSYRRIASEYKEEFILHFQEIFLQAKDNDLLCKEIFSKTSWHDLQSILANPLEYNMKHMKELSRSTEKRTALNRLKWCYQDNGLKYTIKHIIKRGIFVFKSKLKAIRTKLKIKNKKEKMNEYTVKPVVKHINKVETRMNEKVDGLQILLQQQNEQMQILINNYQILLEKFEVLEQKNRQE